MKRVHRCWRDSAVYAFCIWQTLFYLKWLAGQWKEAITSMSRLPGNQTCDLGNCRLLSLSIRVHSSTPFHFSANLRTGQGRWTFCQHVFSLGIKAKTVVLLLVAYQTHSTTGQEPWRENANKGCVKAMASCPLSHTMWCTQNLKRHNSCWPTHKERAVRKIQECRTMFLKWL